MDITYIPMARGFVYLAVVLDWFSRRVLSWRLSITMEAAFCVETLEDALACHGKPEIFNTDQGSQFTGAAFTGVLIKNGIAISMDGKGAWRDNIFVERLWRSIKYEEVYLRGYDSVSEAALRSANTSLFTTVGGPTRALTARHPIKLTSPRCHSAWQPNPGRGSTYRRGKTVQTTGATSVVLGCLGVALALCSSVFGFVNSLAAALILKSATALPFCLAASSTLSEFFSSLMYRLAVRSLISGQLSLSQFVQFPCVMLSLHALSVAPAVIACWSLA